MIALGWPLVVTVLTVMAAAFLVVGLMGWTRSGGYAEGYRKGYADGVHSREQD